MHTFLDTYKREGPTRRLYEKEDPKLLGPSQFENTDLRAWR